MSNKVAYVTGGMVVSEPPLPATHRDGYTVIAVAYARLANGSTNKKRGLFHGRSVTWGLGFGRVRQSQTETWSGQRACEQ
jgi:hypothetical protein